ncbi:MAG: glutamine-hydrolyzing GMP synthase, partial [Chitinophagaceae bacterium]
MTEKILILDFGSQFTQLIARCVREANVYSEIVPYNHPVNLQDVSLKGIILSGSPCSVNDEKAPAVDVKLLNEHLPILSICYGAQLTAKQLGGEVNKSNKREYGRAHIQLKAADTLFNGVANNSQVWMSHSDSIVSLPLGFSVLATTESIPVAAFKKDDNTTNALYGLQFHPEVYHSTDGKKMIANFLTAICGCTQNWTPASFINETVEKLKATIGNKQVIMALSGGVDSTVAATLISKAIGNRLHGIFVDNGLLRKNEFEQVLGIYKQLNLNVKGVNAKQRFYDALAGIADPETKRKTIGKLFIDVFNDEAHLLTGIDFLGQGTIYPDVIESVSVHGGPSATIKSHHNVGGLP